MQTWYPRGQMIKIPYNFRKALINAAFIFSGVIVVKLSPYLDQLTLGNIPHDLTFWNFWRHIIVSGFVVTGTAEFRYIIKWLATMNGTTTQINIINPIVNESVTKDDKKNLRLT